MTGVLASAGQRLAELRPALADNLGGPAAWLGPLRRWRIPLYGVRSPAAGSMLLAGEHRTLDYLRHCFAGDAPRVESLGSVALLGLPKALARLGAQFDVTAAAVDTPAAGRLFDDNWLRLPEVVDAWLPVPAAGASPRWPKNAKENARRVRSRGFTWSFTRNVADFDDFFERMCLPYALKRHAGLVHRPDRTALRREFRRGGLMLIEHEGTAIAGGVFAIVGNVLCGRTLGAVDGNEALLRLGVLNCLYVFGVELARQLGLEWYNLGASMPFLGDGPLYHKLSWGAALHRRATSHRDVLLGWPRYNEVVARLLARTAPLVRDGSGFSALLTAGSPADGDDATLCRRYSGIGLTRLVRIDQRSATTTRALVAGGESQLVLQSLSPGASRDIAGAMLRGDHAGGPVFAEKAEFAG